MKKKLPSPRTAVIHELYDPERGKIIDVSLFLWFSSTNSFTGEDVLEIHTHGGRAVREATLRAILSLKGIRLAEPGEFSARAFMAGRIDLTEAEGVADLVAAETESQRIQALRQMGGSLKELYERWRQKLVSLLAKIEAEIDFSDEDLPTDLNSVICSETEDLLSEIKNHLNDNKKGQKLREGIRVVLLGPPNSGKSSLMNILAGRDVAIVSNISGTTRDIIEISLDLDGIPANICDTAGIHNASEEIEKEGIRRSHKEAKISDIKIMILDGEKWPEIPSEIIELFDDDTIIILNKSDLVKNVKEKIVKKTPLSISCLTSSGIPEFMNQLTEMVKNRYELGDNPLITRERHRLAVSECYEALKRSLLITEIELKAEDLRQASNSLARITGRIDIEDVLDIVFKDFCIGK